MPARIISPNLIDQLLLLDGGTVRMIFNELRTQGYLLSLSLTRETIQGLFSLLQKRAVRPDTLPLGQSYSYFLIGNSRTLRSIGSHKLTRPLPLSNEFYAAGLSSRTGAITWDDLHHSTRLGDSSRDYYFPNLSQIHANLYREHSNASLSHMPS